jgi:nucleoside-diphosphate-sugar epimerase
MKTLLTGITGKFGPYLVREMMRYGHEIALFSRERPGAEFKDLEWIRGDLNRVEDCIAAVCNRGFDAIHNAAAMADPTDTPGMEGYDDPAFFPLAMQTNIMGLYNMLQAALRGDVGIFVNTGSNCVLGHGYRLSKRPFAIHYLPFDESHPSDVEDSYSFSKLVGEQLLESYAKAYGMRCYALRASSIFDAGERAALKAGSGRVEEWDEWLFVWTAPEDLAAAHRMIMERAESIVPFGAYYCNSDDTYAPEPTMDIIRRFRPGLIPLIREPLEERATLFSSKRLKAAVGWKPNFTFASNE